MKKKYFICNINRGTNISIKKDLLKKHKKNAKIAEQKCAKMKVENPRNVVRKVELGELQSSYRR